MLILSKIILLIGFLSPSQIYSFGNSLFLNNSAESKGFLFSNNSISYFSNSSSSSDDYLDKLSTSNEELLQTIKIFLGKRHVQNPIGIHLYNSFEEKGLTIGETYLSHFNYKDNSVHIVINDWINGNDNSDVAQLVIQNSLGLPKYKFLERGLAIKFSTNWRGKGYDYWASRYYLADEIPSLTDLLNNSKIKYESELLIEPLSGTFVDFLIDEFGRELFLKKYSVWVASKEDVLELEEKWKNYLSELSSKYLNKMIYDRQTFPSSIPDYQKGFCFAHEGYDIYNGYLSEEARLALVRLKETNSNSVSITPFTSMRSPNKPVPLKYWDGAHTENDESVIFVNHHSKKLGMNVMLKPHIWITRSWPGDIEMKNDADWKLFFEYYYRWIKHYAILAEIYEMPIFCIGNELSKTMPGHEDEWIEIIKRVRKIYSGKITYGANWGQEFENIKIWEHIDFIGLSQYYPVTKKTSPTNDELIKGFSQIFTTIEKVQKKFNKPILFTEVGYRTSGAPWKGFYEGEERRKFNPENQARVYKILFESMKDREWLKGIYIWKWPSFLDYGKRERGGAYTPVFKPTENIIKEWFSKF